MMNKENLKELTDRELVVIEMCLRLVSNDREQENIRLEGEFYDFPWKHKDDKIQQNKKTISEITDILLKMKGMTK